jgi:hypothetical protein
MSGFGRIGREESPMFAEGTILPKWGIAVLCPSKKRARIVAGGNR